MQMMHQFSFARPSRCGYRIGCSPAPFARSFAMIRLLTCSAVLLTTTFLFGDEAKPLVAPRAITKLVADGKHNAFTALVEWKDAYWLAFRSGKAHNSGDGNIVVMRSADGKEWKPAFVLDVLADDRDPQFLV